ncbi:MAG: ExbD/TolR family protein [Deltaproteobacteria bacterium]|jgi:biopolymer transport protein TolR|nr:ExbD/TolR family protein [Deltaproteobacteria bacterium]
MAHTDELIRGQSEVKSISDINVTPFIDVMLVLLIIFMVTAPLMMGGVHINLPKTSGTPMARPHDPLIVSLDAQSRIFVGKDMVPTDNRMEVFKKMALDSESGEVFVRGDGGVKYAEMIDLMTELGQAGFARVTLVTNVQGGADPNALPDTPASPAAPAGATPTAGAAAATPATAAPATPATPATPASPAAPATPAAPAAPASPAS